MTTYHSYGVTLSSGQKQKLARAYQTNSAITIRLSSGELTGNDKLMLTKRQIAKLIKAKRSGKGSDIRAPPAKQKKKKTTKPQQKGGIGFDQVAWDMIKGIEINKWKY